MSEAAQQQPAPGPEPLSPEAAVAVGPDTGRERARTSDLAVALEDFAANGSEAHPGGVRVNALVAFDSETRTAMCRRCWISEDDVATAEEGKAWHATHRRGCTVATPPSGTVLPFPERQAGA